MAIHAFRGVRYVPGRVDTDRVLAPPHDAVTPALHDALLAQEPRNAVRLTMPKAVEDTPLAPYQQAAFTFADWRRAGLLAKDDGPAMYYVRQTFVPPGEGADCPPRVRDGFIAVVDVDDEGQPLFAHERTIPGRAEHGRKLLELVDAHLEPVFLLAEDPAQRIERLFSAAVDREPDVEGTVQDVHVQMWVVDDAGLCMRVAQAVETGLVIADGHHRIETARAYAARHAGEGPGRRGLLAYVCGAEQDGLWVRPFHRMVKAGAVPSAAELLDKLAPFFTVEPLGPSEDPVARLKACDPGRAATALLSPDGSHMLLTLRQDAPLSDVFGQDPGPLTALDAVIVDQVICQHVLGLDEAEAKKNDTVCYQAGSPAVKDALNGDGGFGLAFLVRPAPVGDVVAAAKAGLFMPAKSTAFHPKVPSGLVFQALGPSL